MTPEKNIQNGILRFLKSLEQEGLPIFSQRRQAGGFSYKKGLPDVYCVINGKHVEIEVKRPGGQLSSAQETWRDKFHHLGIERFCFDSVEECKKQILLLLEKYI